MEKISKDAIYIALIVALGLAYYFKPEKVVEKEVIKTEVVTKEVHDTTVVEVPKEVEKHTIDTIYIHDGGGDKLQLVYARTRYAEPDLYDVWIEGYNAQLSSIMVFPKTVYSTITNTIERGVEAKRWNAYLGVNLGAIGNTFGGGLGVYVTSPRKFLFGANFGYVPQNGTMLKNNFYFGGTIAYKLTK